MLFLAYMVIANTVFRNFVFLEVSETDLFGSIFIGDQSMCVSQNILSSAESSMVDSRPLFYNDDVQ